jgi:hypothetical protein
MPPSPTSLERALRTISQAAETAARFFTRTLATLFASPAAAPLPRRLAFVALVVVGLTHWLWFFGGSLALDFEDWPKERAYLDLLREAISTRTLPLHMDVSLQMTQRFLAIPETMLAPHVLLLPWLTNQQFIALQACVMFLAGTIGCWKLARRFDWSAFTFFAFATVFSFNGFIVCRLSVGHFMWAGYYLFPWMLLATLRLLENSDAPRRWLELSGLIFALFLIGSFHLAVWWMLFLGVVALARPRLLFPVGVALALAAVLCLFRIAPAAVTFGGVHREFGTGFPDLLTLWRALVVSLGYDTPFVQTPRVSLGWWEFNHFVGLPAVLFTLLFAVRPAAKTADSHSQAALLIGAGVLAVLSLSQFYAPIASLPLPLFNSERVTTRFISVAFFVALFCACTRFNRDAARLSPGWQALAFALLIQTLIELRFHSAAWRPAVLEASHGPSSYWENAATLTAHIQPFAQETKYKLVLAGSWAVSGLALIGTLLAWLRLRPSPRA